MKKTLLLLISGSLFSQVGINTEEPTAMLDVVGDVRFREIPTGVSTDSILVTNNGYVRKISISDLGIQGNHRCPILNRQESGGWYIKFESDYSIPDPNSSLVIEGINFVSAGTWIEENEYHYSYSNTTGQGLNLNSFQINFHGLLCNYQQ